MAELWGGARAPRGSLRSRARASCPLRRNAVDPAGLRFRNCAAANPCGPRWLSTAIPPGFHGHFRVGLFVRVSKTSIADHSSHRSSSASRDREQVFCRRPPLSTEQRGVNSSFNDDNLALADVAGGSRYSGHGTAQKEVGRIRKGGSPQIRSGDRAGEAQRRLRKEKQGGGPARARRLQRCASG